MNRLLNFFDFKQVVNHRLEILSGITVALALIPEAVAFAMIAGLSPLTGLYAAFMVGLVASIFGGRPGMISGATGAIAVIIAPLALMHGVEYVFAAVILAGVFQIGAGLFKLGKLMRLVPQPVIFGFVNGLAIIIGGSQISQFKDASGAWLQGNDMYVFCGLVALAMLIIALLPKLTKAIPGGLVAIVVVFALAYGLDLDTKTVGDIASISGGFPPFHLPNLPFSIETLQIILPFSVVIASVGLIESLLTLNIVDELTQTRGKGK